MVNMSYVLTIIVVLMMASALDASLIFDTADVQVIPGQSLTLTCGVKQDFRLCFWENDRGDIFQVEDVHAGVHPGMRTPEDLTDNQCGVVIESLGVEDLGKWTCKVLLAGRSLVGSKKVGKTKAVECIEPFVRLGDHCYYFYESGVKTWEEAREYCLSMGTWTDLAVVNDCHQLTLVWDHILMYYNSSRYWIGGADLGQEGSWYFVDGSTVPVGTPFWYPDNPSGNGNCLSLSFSHGYFDDEDCEIKVHFVCQAFE
ncbi:regenerating islet-derived protein 4-like isoform X2 [Cherax quadricarinatus]